MASDTPVWLVTGCSTGFGRALAQLIVDCGWRLVATARDKARLDDLAAGAGERVLAADLDVTRPEQIVAVAVAAKARFGRIDVLVNNAGYGHQSTAKEGEEAEIRVQFDANVFGLFAMTRAVLPIMRAQRAGRVINVTSVAGLIGFPGSTYYAASKHAVEGFSDALRAEVEPLGIGLSCVEPGPSAPTGPGARCGRPAPASPTMEQSAGARQDGTKTMSGTQPGDPVRAGEVVIQLAEMAEPPRHLPLGAWGFDAVLADRRRRLTQIEGVRAMSVAADFPTA